MINQGEARNDGATALRRKTLSRMALVKMILGKNSMIMIHVTVHLLSY
jgi:hypothetical protein